MPAARIGQWIGEEPADEREGQQDEEVQDCEDDVGLDARRAMSERLPAGPEAGEHYDKNSAVDQVPEPIDPIWITRFVPRGRMLYW